ncbi:hypothetical protein P3T16_006825 [Paraburkholderia sp. GAS42]
MAKRESRFARSSYTMTDEYKVTNAFHPQDGAGDNHLNTGSGDLKPPQAIPSAARFSTG